MNRDDIEIDIQMAERVRSGRVRRLAAHCRMLLAELRSGPLEQQRKAEQFDQIEAELRARALPNECVLETIQRLIA